MRLPSIPIVAALIAVLAAPTYAETVLIPIASQGEALKASPRPKRGSKPEQVRSEFGEPLNIQAASGEPPITRWDYENFSVYFEGDTVIHSVIRHRPGQQP